MFVAFEMEATVDKKVRETPALGCPGAQQYLARSFGEREGEHVGHVVFVFSFKRYRAHLARVYKRNRKVVSLA